MKTHPGFRTVSPATDKSFLKKSTVRQTVHIIILCNWLPFYRPCSFASQTFVCFANYFLLQLSQRGNFITSQYFTMCEQNFTALIYEKVKKENNRYICIGIYSNCSPASAKVIFVYMFLMISRKVTFVTQKFANPNKSNTFHNYLLTSGSSAYSPAYPSFCYFPPFCFTPLFSGTKKVHTLSYKLDLRSQATHFFIANIIFYRHFYSVNVYRTKEPLLSPVTITTSPFSLLVVSRIGNLPFSFT